MDPFPEQPTSCIQDILILGSGILGPGMKINCDSAGGFKGELLLAEIFMYLDILVVLTAFAE